MPFVPIEAGSLAPYVEAGVLHEADVQVAGAVARNVADVEPEVLLAVALCVRALGMGHVCVVLDDVAESVVADSDPPGSKVYASALYRSDVPGSASTPVGDGVDRSVRRGADVVMDVEADAPPALPWPDPEAWASVLAASPAVVVRDAVSGSARGAAGPGVILPLAFDGTRVYLERYWRYERHVGDRLLADAAETMEPTSTALDAALDRYFGADDPTSPDLQRQAASVALRRRVTVLAGGPGTGKTYTVARLLAAAHEIAEEMGAPLEVALAAPTGKAAARMTEAVRQAVGSLDVTGRVSETLHATEASTIHRLLGWLDGVTFRHGEHNPLPHDLVVVDETSMVALPLMAKLLDALRPGARLVLVGDPFQLASVEAGAVLGDIVGPGARGRPATGPMLDSIVVLDRVHRFESGSGIGRLASAVRSGDADLALEVLRDSQADEVVLIDPDDTSSLAQLRELVATEAAEVVRLALEGDAAATVEASLRLKVLCGTRWGPLGSYAWRDEIERRLSKLVRGTSVDRRWYLGRPVIITRNDYLTRVFNGDTGIVIARGGRPVVAMQGSDGIRELSPSQLDQIETWWSMTIHKSQGSEFGHAVVSLPAVHSRILTNELLYTGITRGKQRVTVVATEEALRTAVERPIRRASGLGARLWP